MKFIFAVLVLFYSTFSTATADDYDWYKTGETPCKDLLVGTCDNDQHCKWFSDGAGGGVCKYDACRKFDNKKTECGEAGWCVYTNAATCVHDSCLTYIATTPTPSPATACSSQPISNALAGQGECALYYFTNKTSCSGVESLDDYFCQFLPNNPATKDLFVVPAFDYCFYGRLKNGGTSCDPSLCEPFKVPDSLDRYICQSNGDEDCSSFSAQPAAWCGCVTSEIKCNLSPYCWWNSGQCNYDICTEQFDNGDCSRGGCYRRNMRVKKTDGTKGTNLVSMCVNRSRDSEKLLPNECFFLLSTTDACASESEEFCTGANTLDTKGDGGQNGHLGYALEDSFCKVVEVADGLFEGLKYCADTRDVLEVPGDSSVLVRIPSLLAILLIALAFVI